MTDMRLAVGGWWSVIERKSRPACAAPYFLLKMSLSFQNSLTCFFSVHKIQVRVYFVIHFFLQNKTFKAPRPVNRTRAFIVIPPNYIVHKLLHAQKPWVLLQL